MCQLRVFIGGVAAALWIVATAGACGVDSSAGATPIHSTGPDDGSAAATTADGSPLAIVDAPTRSPPADDGSSGVTTEAAANAGTDSAAQAGIDASSPSAIGDARTLQATDGALVGWDGATDGGVVDIYRSCAPVALTQHYADPTRFTLDYPARWTGLPAATNSYAFTAPYSYVPTGSSMPTTALASVTTLTGTTATDAANVQRFLQDRVSGYPVAVVRRFATGGGPAIAWWYREAPATCGVCMGPPDPGPDLIFISVAASHGLDIVVVSGYARINAPAQTFCDIQAIESSLAFQ